MVGFLLLSQFRADIIDARTQSLTTQANIIAAAIAASAAVETDTITLDPEKLLQLAPGETPPPAPNDEDAIDILDQSRAGRPGAASPGDADATRARASTTVTGSCCSNSQTVSSRASTSRSDASDPANEDTTWLQRAWSAVRRIFVRPKAPRGLGNWADNGKSLPEVAEALAGKVGSIVRVNSDGETIVSVAVPIQRTSADPRRPGPVDSGPRHRQGDRQRTLGALAILPGRGGGDAHSLDLASQYDRRTLA